MPNDVSPKYLSLARLFQEQIERGELLPGDRLPSFTQMRARFGATPATVERVYAQLERANLIERRNRSGVYVADTTRLSTQKGTLGFVAMSFQNAHLHPYNHHLLRGVREAATKTGVQILLLDRNEIESARDKVDGFLAYEHNVNAYVVPRIGLHPCVSLVMPSDAVSSVVADDFDGGKKATQHLLELGHRRIAALMGSVPEDGHDVLGERRLAGYRAALREANIEPQKNWVRPLLYNPLENYAERGYSLMTKWLQGNWNVLGCTAILAQNDDVAIGIIGALREAGLQVPRDVSVIGFDGAGVDEHFAPRLTTVEVALSALAERGTQLLLQLLANQSARENIVMPVKLRLGESSAPPP